MMEVGYIITSHNGQETIIHDRVFEDEADANGYASSIMNRYASVYMVDLTKFKPSIKQCKYKTEAARGE